MYGLRVVVCGSSRLIRQKVTRHLEALCPDARVVGEAPTPEGAVLLTRRHAPHLVVVTGGSDDEELETAVHELRRATPSRTHVVLMPDTVVGRIEGAAAVLPRSRYTNRAMSAALGRLLARI